MSVVKPIPFVAATYLNPDLGKYVERIWSSNQSEYINLKDAELEYSHF
jgi:hypothetical protein